MVNEKHVTWQTCEKHVNFSSLLMYFAWLFVTGWMFSLTKFSFQQFSCNVTYFMIMFYVIKWYIDIYKAKN